MKTAKTEANWCGTCQQLRKLLDLAANDIDKMSPGERPELRNKYKGCVPRSAETWMNQPRDNLLRSAGIILGDLELRLRVVLR